MLKSIAWVFFQAEASRLFPDGYFFDEIDVDGWAIYAFNDGESQLEGEKGLVEEETEENEVASVSNPEPVTLH